MHIVHIARIRQGGGHSRGARRGGDFEATQGSGALGDAQALALQPRFQPSLPKTPDQARQAKRFRRSPLTDRKRKTPPGDPDGV